MNSDTSIVGDEVAATPSASGLGLGTEWQRIELLGVCLLETRQGKPIGEDKLAALRQFQANVARLRLESDLWHALPVSGLTRLEMDILACALAAEAQPRLAWLYLALQPGATQPYATIALLQSLLALENESIALLWQALLPDHPLRRRGLLESEGHGPFQIVKPNRGIVARLLGVPLRESPPGAVLISQQADWDDLILPEDRKEMIREFLLWVRHRDTVVNQWKGQKVGGPVALFAGPSGTGKTFAAVAIAQTLNWPLFRVDLGKLVSKYLGETEKNLNRLFDAAHNQQIVLQFDEVDSVMGKRAEIREARDRYANMEVSHLLSRIEQHNGPCILTTNMRNHLDHAFYRRFQVVVEFPPPDAAARTRLWEKLLPREAPREANVSWQFLGQAVSLTGGNIRNAALHAAYLAADAQRPISLSHLATSVWRELTKSGKPVSVADLGALEAHLPASLSAQLRRTAHS